MSVVKGLSKLKDRVTDNYSTDYDISFNIPAILQKRGVFNAFRMFSEQVVGTTASKIKNQNQTWTFVARGEFIKSILESFFSYGSGYKTGAWEFRAATSLGEGFVPDPSKPIDYRTYLGEPIIVLSDMKLAKGDTPKWFKAGDILLSLGWGRSDASMVRMEDPDNPRERPLTVGNQNTGTWDWKKVAETRGVEWEFTQSTGKVSGEHSADKNSVTVTTNYGWHIYSIELDQELYLLNTYKDGRLIHSQYLRDSVLEEDARINIFTNLARATSLEGSFGEMITMPCINYDKRRACEHYLSNKWNVNLSVAITAPAGDFEGDSNGVWQGLNHHPYIYESDMMNMKFFADQGIIEGRGCDGKYIANATNLVESNVFKVASSSANTVFSHGRWFATSVKNPNCGFFWEEHTLDSNIYRYVGYISEIEPESSTDRNTSGEQRYVGFYEQPYGIPSSPGYQPFTYNSNAWFEDWMDQWMVDNALIEVAPIHELTKSIDWLVLNDTNRLRVDDGVEATDYTWVIDEDNVILTDLANTHNRRSFNGNLCLISQKYAIGGTPNGLEVDGIRGFYNRSTDVIDVHTRGAGPTSANFDGTISVV